MNKFLLDTNYLLDIAIEHREGSDDAAALFDAISCGSALGVISPTSLKDFYYIARKHVHESTRRSWIGLFSEAFAIADLGREQCMTALRSSEPDFEDGIIRAIAEQESCTAIVSRDETAFIGSSIPKMTAAQALQVR